MSMLILINIVATLLIAAIIWWFWIAKPKVVRGHQDVTEIIVEGGVYSPAAIEVSAGESIQLRFIRKDASPCAEKVVFDKLGLSADLELEKPKDLVLNIQEKGTVEFTCQMGMYRGRLIVS